MSLSATFTASEKDVVVAPNTAVSGADTVPSWCIFVKTVGKGFDDRRVNVNNDGADTNNDEPGKLSSVDGSFSFHVTVSPEDRIDFLHDEIQGVTGVKASQQRLIYRGRLIGKSDVASVSHNSSTSTNNDENTNTVNSFHEKADQNALTTFCKNEQQQGYKIKDIVGLCDGQTIHLVKKRDSEKTKSNINSSDTVNEQGTLNDSRNNDNDDSASNNTSTESEAGGIGGGGALLAALLGLETRFAEDDNTPDIEPISPGTRTGVTNNNHRNNVQATTATTNRAVASPWRSLRATANANNDGDTTSDRSPRHNSRPHYRLGAEDLEVDDPGSMESVRQGLMTLNTIINSQPHQQNTNIRGGLGTVGEEGRRNTHHPLVVNREWFRGQWIDARDTVNQWLEATVVDIIDSRDVLNDTVTLRNPASSVIHARRYGSTETPQQQPRQRRVPNIDNDPAISVNDLEGRRRLLLEVCEPGDPREITIGTDTDSNQSSLQLPVATGPNSSQSFRPRSSNNGVNLLLIHYNGWPHRWDEWIRSDSERLRPFRTRTRHPNTSYMALPTPQAIFNEAPRTNIIEDGGDEEDRFAILPELNIALSRVSELLGDLVQRERGPEHNSQSKDYDEDELEDLRSSNTRNDNNTNPNANYQRAKAELPWMTRDSGDDMDNCDRDPTRTSTSEQDGARPSTLSNLDGSNEETHELEYVTNEDDAFSEEELHSSDSSRHRDVRTLYNQGELRNLATLFDRLGRTLTDVAPHVASIAASLPAHEHTHPSSDEQNPPTTTESSNSFDYDTSSTPLGGLLSLWSRERERARRNNIDQENATTRPATSTAPVDPDHIDFASGIVNTIRGEVRSGPRSRASHQDDVASLLGTYLAAASLGSATSPNDDNGSGATSSLARLLQRGSGGGSGDNGIDIHIHAIVTAPGVSPGGMGIATLSSGGSSPTATLSGARNVFSSNRSNLRADGGILRSGTSLSSTFVEPTDEEDYSDLFSELYSESPTPIDPNGSPVQEESESIANPSVNRNTDDDDSDNNCSLTNVRDNFEQLESPGDTSLVTPTSNRSRSSPRRESTERRSGVFRLFRRRGSRANNQDGSNNEET